MQIFSPHHIATGVEATTQQQLLEHVAALATNAGHITNEAAVVTGMLDREKLTSTALMEGIAIPHVKSTDVTSPALFVVRAAQPVSWTNGEDVSTLVTMMVPEAEAGTTHLKILAQIARALMKKDVQQVLAHGSDAEIFEVLSSKLDLN